MEKKPKRKRGKERQRKKHKNYQMNKIDQRFRTKETHTHQERGERF